jgi:hypothetical protein
MSTIPPIFLPDSCSAHSFLPARPEKNLIEGRRMTDTFIEARRAALERYLCMSLPNMSQPMPAASDLTHICHCLPNG